MQWEEMENKFKADLLEKRIIYLEGKINNEAANLFGKAIVWLNVQSETEITLYIDSSGGDVVAGLDIYDMIKHSKAPIIGIVYRRANSMASTILQACHKRAAFEHSEIMTHNISIERQINEWEKKGKEIFEKAKKDQDRIYQIFSEKSRLSLEIIKKMFDDEKRFSAEEAKKYCFIDEVIY